MHAYPNPDAPTEYYILEGAESAVQELQSPSQVSVLIRVKTIQFW